jgi:chromate transporter
MPSEAPLSAAGRVITNRELFLGFLKIGLLGFGGIAPWARHVIVEERKWLTDAEFASMVGLGQVLPGPSTMNASVMIGDRFKGVPGVLMCLSGQLAVPLVVVTGLWLLYGHYALVPEVKAAVMGGAAGAAGLVMGTALKMARKIQPAPLALLVGAATFAAIGLLRWPLVPVVLAAAPLSIFAAMLEKRG